MNDDVREGAPGTSRRKSTFLNAHALFRLFTGRNDPSGRDEQFERFYIMVIQASPDAASIEAYEAGNPKQPIGLDHVLDDLLNLVAERNSDFYEYDSGSLIRRPG